MRSVWRGLALAALTIPTLLALPSGVAGAAAAASNTSAFESIGGCFAAQKHVLVALVMDESASLGDAATGKPGTDPTARRVTAAQVAIDGIANLTAQGTDVDVLLTGFSDELHQYGTWQRLDSRSRTGIKQQLEGFRTRDTGLDTDFYTAIAGVQQALARQVTALGNRSQPCELVLLFTDGRFDIDTHVPKPYDANGNDPKDVKAARGIAALCTPSGPMQRLRNDGARTITLALADPSAGAGAADPAFLQRLATGDCNTAGSQYGASFDATNAADLVGQFDAVATRLRGATAISGNCSAPETLQIVPALRGLHIFVDAGASASNVVITPPGSPPISISPANGRTPQTTGIDLSATATGNRFVIIEAAPSRGTATDSPRWSGRWKVSLSSASGGAHCAISVFESWKPRARTVTLQRGVRSTIVFDMIGEDGRPTPAGALPANARVVASLASAASTGTSAALNVVRVGPNYQAVFTLPKSFTGQAAIVTATLHVTLAGTDIVSSPSATELRVRQSGFPSIFPSTLELTNIKGLGTSIATISIVGDAAYAGTVCINQVSYPTLPPVPTTQLASTPIGTCAQVAPGKKTTLAFSVLVGTEGDGRVSGLLDLRLTGAGGKRIVTTVPFTFNITKPISTSTRNTLFLLLLVGGVGAPILFLYYFAYRSAALEIPPGVRAARIRVRVFADGSIRRLVETGEAPPLALVESDFEDAGTVPGTVRFLEWHDLEFFARVPRNPLSPPLGQVSVRGQYVTASDGVLRGGRRGTFGRVPLALPGAWVFALDPEANAGDEHLQAVDGTLTVFIAAGAPFVDQAPRVMYSLTQFFAQLARRIDTRAGAPLTSGRS